MTYSRIALVTGGNSGIGYATAKVLKAQGDTVIITGRRKEAVEKAAAELGVLSFVADQGNLRDVERLAAWVASTFERLDILFINAGVLVHTPIEKATEQDFDSVMDVNLKGAYFTLSRFIPLLSDGASVVFLSSNTATRTSPGASIYASSKAALNSVVKTAALELAGRKIRVNAVSPGPTHTEILNKLGYEEAELEKLKGWIIDRVPLQKMGHAGDVGKMVAYLSSEAAAFITGSEIIMDGGMVLG
jgi:NAD(P)-dependent dehydrogenase (short-subunit alcohol dehydrogenase family)